MYIRSKKEEGGLGVAHNDKEDIWHNVGFGSRNPQWFFPSFFATKKGGRGALDST